jgi:branched-chain amino acid transport system ATP-binding protein
MTAPALEVVQLSKSFGGISAIADVSFTVPAGSLTALIGPNGAGKTTLFNLVTNLFTPDAGTVRFHNTPLDGMPLHRVARLGLHRTFQTARVFPGMSALDNVLAGAHGQVSSSTLAQMLWLPGARREEHALTERAKALLDLVGLGAYRDATATSLPMGAQKLVELCRALMGSPRLLLLDEPAAGLNDTETAALAQLLRAVRDVGITVLVVEHNMSLVMDVADDIVVLDLGRLIATGTPAVIQRDQRVIEAYLGAAPESAHA